MLTIRRSVVGLVIIACLLMVIAGCGNNGNNASGNPNGGKTQRYADDGYLGRTSSYPKIPGPNMANTYDSDTQMMREAIRNVPGVGGANFTVNGSEVYVTIKLTPDLQTQETSTVERQAASVLRFNFPRYTFRVSSSRG